MAYFQGRVNGVDAQATPGLNPRCQIFINKSKDEYIQVTTSQLGLLAALKLACLKDVEVDVDYDDSTGENILTRVRVLDR